MWRNAPKKRQREISVRLHGVTTLPDFAARAMYDGSEAPEAHYPGGVRPTRPLTPEIESAADAAIAAATAEMRARKLARMGKPQGDPKNLD